MTGPTIWHGTDAERAELLGLLQKGCVCPVDHKGCGHRFWDSQRQIDGLVFGRRIAHRLRNEEWTGEPSEHTED